MAITSTAPGTLVETNANCTYYDASVVATMTTHVTLDYLNPSRGIWEKAEASVPIDIAGQTESTQSPAYYTAIASPFADTVGPVYLAIGPTSRFKNGDDSYSIWWGHASDGLWVVFMQPDPYQRSVGLKLSDGRVLTPSGDIIAY